MFFLEPKSIGLYLTELFDHPDSIRIVLGQKDHLRFELASALFAGENLGTEGMVIARNSDCNIKECTG